MTHIYAISFGFFLDLWLGDPPWLIKRISHPVIYIGKSIEKTEHFLRPFCPTTKKSQRLCGFFLLFMICFFFTGLTYCTLFLAYNINFFCGFFLETLLSFQILATKSLEVESLKVYHALKEDNLEKSRMMLSYIVGRETSHLEEEEIIKATVETVAENTTDGVVAPFIYLFLFGATGGILYKCINTLDSMVGYKNQVYQYFGTASAKTDDLFNFFPARFTAFMMILSTFILKLQGKNAVRIFLRDRFSHKSPNAGQTESVISGALGIQLGGNAYYFGELYEKDTIGDPLRPIEMEDIKTTITIMKFTSYCSYLFLLALYIFVVF